MTARSTGLAEVGLGPIFEFAQNERGNLRRSEDFVAEHDANDVFACRIDAEREKFQFALHVGGAAAHQSLDGIDGALRLREQAARAGFADDDAAIGIEADHRGTQRAAVRARNTLRLARLRISVRDEAVGRPEIDSNDASHYSLAAPNSFATLSTKFRMYERRFSNSFRRLMISLAVGVVGVCVDSGVPLLAVA